MFVPINSIYPMHNIVQCKIFYRISFVDL